MATSPRCLALFERPDGIQSVEQLDLALALLDGDVKAGRLTHAQGQLIRRAAGLLRRAWRLQDRERAAKVRALGLRVLQGGVVTPRPRPRGRGSKKGSSRRGRPITPTR